MARRVVLLLLLLPALVAGCERQVPPASPPLSVTEVLGGVPAEGFLRAVRPRSFRFPADHRSHPGFRTEWWYFTGNLRSSDGHSFGYQLTFFRNALVPHPVQRASAWGIRDAYMAHLAITDIDGQRFRASERLSRDSLGLAGAGGSPLRVHLESWEARETGQTPWSMHLFADDGTQVVDLDVQSLKPPVLNGDRGLSRKGAAPGNASYYYSIPRLATKGQIRVNGNSYTVSGLSWFDREWSTSAIEPEQTGWDWFSLQLDDGRDLVVYRLRRRDGTVEPLSGATLVAADGSYRTLSISDIVVEAKGLWQSRETGTRYPVSWRVAVPAAGLDLDVVPAVAAQELVVSFTYWEGAVRVRGRGGSPGGSGYLELAGYGEPGAEKGMAR